jgi:hypothetical protein
MWLPFRDRLEMALSNWDSFLRNHVEITSKPIQTPIQSQEISATVYSTILTENIVVVLNLHSRPWNTVILI